MNKVDVVIIGAGPAGAISAAKLKKDGFSVLVLEKMTFPRFVIGESLLPKCMNYLDDLDLLPAIQAENFQKKTGASFLQDDKICHFEFSKMHTDGWEYTYQVKRADFDYALIKAVEAKGVDVEFRATVTNVEATKEKQTIYYENSEGIAKTVESRFLIDASGYGRVLPRLFNLDKPTLSKSRSAIFSHFTDTNKFENESTNILVHAFNNNTSWIWAIPFSDDTCSVGLVGDAEFIEKCAEDNASGFKRIATETPFMKRRFGDSKPLFEPKSVTNYSTSVSKLYGDGFVLVGNSTEFLDPIFSSGVTLAMSSGYLGAELVAKELNGEKVDWQTEYSNVMNDGIDVFRSYVNAWYTGEFQKIIFSQNTNETYKHQICSVLAGYVWDKSNPFITKHKTILKTLAKVIEMAN